MTPPILCLAGKIHQFDAAFSDRLNDLMVMIYDLFRYFVQLYFYFFSIKTSVQNLQIEISVHSIKVNFQIFFTLHNLIFIWSIIGMHLKNYEYWENIKNITMKQACVVK